jgi:uncharacterized iron-regulated membrane protein
MTRLSPEVQRPLRGVATPPAALPQKLPTDRPQAASFYRVVWRWHFYAGMIVAPVLLVVAATGALYIFKAELERVMYSGTMFVEPAAEHVPLDDQLAAAVGAAGDGFAASQLVIDEDPTRATAIYLSNGKTYHSAYVDPGDGRVLGQLDQYSFFPVVLKIHRQLFVGTTGRIVVELVTCWTIVLVVTGLYLWWPRRKRQVWGVWLPRLRGGFYRALRDLHAVSGAYVAAIALVIAATGLVYTYVWGSGYSYAAIKTGAYSVFTDPPQSTSSADVPRISLDEVTRIAREKMPEASLTHFLPRVPGGAFVVFASRPIGPTSDEYLVLDHGTGAILTHKTNAEYPALGWWATWNYPLHIGSVLGLPTKILWLIAALALMAMPVSGVWMWWQRRPQGTAGLPRKVDARVPRGVIAIILSLAIFLPALGASLVVVLLGERVVRLARG